jgi:hypothetical protein
MVYWARLPASDPFEHFSQGLAVLTKDGITGNAESNQISCLTYNETIDKCNM